MKKALVVLIASMFVAGSALAQQQPGAGGAGGAGATGAAAGGITAGIVAAAVAVAAVAVAASSSNDTVVAPTTPTTGTP